MSKQIVKISDGCVRQVFDARTLELVSQEFVAVDHVEFEDEDGNHLDCCSLGCEDVYHPFDMIQPDKDGVELAKAFENDLKNK